MPSTGTCIYDGHTKTKEEKTMTTNQWWQNVIIRDVPPQHTLKPFRTFANDEKQSSIQCSSYRTQKKLISFLLLLIGVVSVLNLTHEKEVKHRFIEAESRAHRGEKGSYNAKTWWSDRTVDVLTLAESKFARCDIHSVLSEDGNRIVNDWIFLEERDAVNVAVFTDEGKLIVFTQNKYAIPGETLSPVGGFIDEGESPWEAARREVLEELGLGSRRTLQMMTAANTNESQLEIKLLKSLPASQVNIDKHGLAVGDIPNHENDWVFLGRYRTAANRGGGWIFTYLLKNAVPILPNGGTEIFKGIGDDELQKINMLSLSEVEERVISGHFQEVKWAATIALSLLHLK